MRDRCDEPNGKLGCGIRFSTKSNRAVVMNGFDYSLGGEGEEKKRKLTLHKIELVIKI